MYTFYFYCIFLTEYVLSVTKVKTTQVVGNGVFKIGGGAYLSALLDCLHSDTSVFFYFIRSITLKFVLEVFFPPYMGKELALKCVWERVRRGEKRDRLYNGQSALSSFLNGSEIICLVNDQAICFLFFNKTKQ